MAAAKKATKRKVGTEKRVGRRKHPGVTLATPVGTHWYRLVWRDPDTGKRKKESLDRALNKAECVEAARRRSEEIAERKRELARGATPATGEGLHEAIESYFKAHPHLRDQTVAIYRYATDKLERWATGEGIKSGDELTRGHLMALREALINEPKRAPVKGAKGRGRRAATAERRKPNSINQNLRSLHTVLAYLIDRQSLPKLTHDDLRRALKQLDVERDVTDYLKAADCRRLLEAALRHDAERVIGREDEQRLRVEAKRRGVAIADLEAEWLGVTRDELDEAKRKGTPRAKVDKLKSWGTTPKYEPVAPFVAFVLLSGLRLGEAVDLDWSQVDLDALDDHGQKAGAITLTGSGTKTRRGRVVGLEVSPALRSLLVAMRLRSGGRGRVFPSRYTMVAAAKRLVGAYGAPEGFTWQALRRTCGTHLVNAPGIFGAASVFLSAKQLGHSVQIAERSYLGVVRGIPREATTLESAMQVEGEVQHVVDRVSGERAAVAQVLALEAR